MNLVENVLTVATMLSKRKSHLPGMLTTYDNSKMEQVYEIGLLRGIIRSLTLAKHKCEMEDILKRELHHMQTQMQIREKLTHETRPS